ncbi:LolA family protein [Persephonella sp.]
MKKVFIIFLLLFSISYSSELLDKFENHLKNINSIKGEFLQINLMEGFDEPQTFIGELYITKPYTLKIIYKDPYRQIILVKNKESVIYTPEEKQAVVSTLSEDFLIIRILRNLIENKSLREIFDVIKEERLKDSYLIVLKPKDEKDIKKVELIIKDNLEIYKIKIYGVDSSVELQFAKIKYLNKKLELNIELPKDVEIIRQ